MDRHLNTKFSEDILISSWEKTLKREDCIRLDEHKPEFVSQGMIKQFNSINQHSKIWDQLISSLNAPMSNCGAFSCANALILSRMQDNTLEIMIEALIDINTIEYEVKQAMTFIHNSRKTYIEFNKPDFPKSKRRNTIYEKLGCQLRII